MPCGTDTYDRSGCAGPGTGYLRVGNYLSEFSSEGDRARVRRNLGLNYRLVLDSNGTDVCATLNGDPANGFNIIGKDGVEVTSDGSSLYIGGVVHSEPSETKWEDTESGIRNEAGTFEVGDNGNVAILYENAMTSLQALLDALKGKDSSQDTVIDGIRNAVDGLLNVVRTDSSSIMRTNTFTAVGDVRTNESGQVVGVEMQTITVPDNNTRYEAETETIRTVIDEGRHNDASVGGMCLSITFGEPVVTEEVSVVTSINEI